MRTTKEFTAEMEFELPEGVHIWSSYMTPARMWKMRATSRISEAEAKLLIIQAVHRMLDGLDISGDEKS